MLVKKIPLATPSYSIAKLGILRTGSSVSVTTSTVQRSHPPIDTPRTSVLLSPHANHHPRTGPHRPPPPRASGQPPVCQHNLFHQSRKPPQNRLSGVLPTFPNKLGPPRNQYKRNGSEQNGTLTRFPLPQTLSMVTYSPRTDTASAIHSCPSRTIPRRGQTPCDTLSPAAAASSAPAS